ncbi:MAG: hypothetical protein J6J61_08865 [Muribaculaceae bacterium]|nr:hypothetical protein [Muribaculaceae bacterium]
MKFFRYSVLAIALAAGFASCSDDDDPVLGPQSPGVYFPTDDALEVTLDRKANTFEVTVSRLGETPEATYSLVGEADSEVFTLPTSVKFAEGETTTTVSIAYDQDAMKLDKAYDVFLGFAEGTVISDYGYSSLEMAVTLPAPWKTIGTGTYQDFYVFPSYYSLDDGSYLTYECELQQHEIDETRFRWVHPYGDNFAKACAAVGLNLEPSQYDSENKYYFEFISADKEHVLIPYQSTGLVMDEADGTLYVGNKAGMYYSLGGWPFDRLFQEYPEFFGEMSWGEEEVEDENGEKKTETVVKTIFQGPKLTCLNFEPAPESWYTLTTDPGGYNWWREGVEIKDYNISIAYKGVLNTPDEESLVLADIILGADIVKAKAGLVKTAEPEEAIAAVIAGEVEVQELEEEKNPGLTFAYDGSGDYTLAVVALNEKDEEVSNQVLTFFVADTSAPKEWGAAQTGAMIDGWVIPAFSYNDGSGRLNPEDFAFELPIEENIENPGVYRLIKPWTSEAFPLYANNGNKTTGYNLVIDARNPQWVTMVAQNTGFMLSNGKYIVAGTLADYFVSQGYSQSQITGAGYNNTLDKGIITIPVPTVNLIAEGDAVPEVVGGSFYEEGEEEYATLIALPSASQETVARAKMNRTANKLLGARANSFIRKHSLPNIPKFGKPEFRGKKANVNVHTL